MADVVSANESVLGPRPFNQATYGTLSPLSPPQGGDAKAAVTAPPIIGASNTLSYSMIPPHQLGLTVPPFQSLTSTFQSSHTTLQSLGPLQSLSPTPFIADEPNCCSSAWKSISETVSKIWDDVLRCLKTFINFISCGICCNDQEENSTSAATRYIGADQSSSVAIAAAFGADATNGAGLPAQASSISSNPAAANSNATNPVPAPNAKRRGPPRGYPTTM